MARTKKHKHTDDEQEDIEGTRVYNPKIEPSAKAYVEALAQRQAWQADENNARVKVIEIMRDQGVTTYYLKSGASVELVGGKDKLKIKNPTDDDGNTVRPDKRQVSLIEE